MRITVEQLTFEDFAEAAGALRRIAADKVRRQSRRSAAATLWAVAFGMLILGVGHFSTRLDPSPELRPAWFHLILMGVPMVAMLAFVTVISAAQQAGSWAEFCKRIAITTVPTLAAAALIAVVIWLIGRVPVPRAPAGIAPPVARADWYGTLVPHAMWILILFLFVVIVVRATRKQLRVAWEGMPSLARTKVYDVTPAGVSVDEGVTHRTYQWPALVRFVETPALLLLCPTELTFEILPKRAFASEADLAVVRDLFQTQIVAPEARRPAFAVLPATPAAVDSPTA